MSLFDTLTPILEQDGEALSHLLEEIAAIDARPKYTEAEAMDRGKRIYDAWFREWCETNFPGQFIAIDIENAFGWTSKDVNEAVEAAKRKTPRGVRIYWCRIALQPTCAAMARPTIH